MITSILNLNMTLAEDETFNGKISQIQLIEFCCDGGLKT